MVGVAGSIGIICIAMVLAFSAGIKGYIASMQDDMLSGNPITITESAYDLSAMTNMMEQAAAELNAVKLADKVYISSLIEYIAQMDSTRESVAVENVITSEYIDYLNNMPKDYYQAIVYGYGVDLNTNLYTDFVFSGDGESREMSAAAITAMYTSLLKETEFKDYADYVGMLTPSFAPLSSNQDYILSQYELVGEGSRIATEKNEIMLVLDSQDELSDLLLARYGFYTQDEFLEAVNKATQKDDKGNPIYNEAVYREYFEYEELLGKTLTWYPNNTVFKGMEYENPITHEKVSTYTYNPYGDQLEGEGGLEMKVVGILTPKDSVNFGSLTSGIYYTEAFMDYVFEENADSEIFDYIRNIDEADTTQAALAKYYISYQYEYTFDGETKTGYSAVGPATNAMSMMMGGMSGNSSGSTVDHEETKENFIRSLGGNSIPNRVSIYPISFEEKDKVVSYLEEWNENHDKITFTDTLELVINMINTMIDIVSYALIAFTSISLVVSTVMIGIITYVSVVERIKEIGVIRSLGGRKRDVSNLFIAETAIIGLLAGVFGVGATYLISLIVNISLKPLINYSGIAALPIGNAVILILLSVGLTLISGVLPARSAARKDPVVALRTE
jgi:putative ABC transport system permease protein